MKNKTNKDLIDIAKSLSISGDNESFYEFVNKYIESRNDENTQLTAANVLEVIKSLEKYCRNADITDENVKVALGVDGRQGIKVKNWCRSINDASEKLNTLSLSELKYVMAEASRLCKIKENETDGKNQNSAKDRNKQNNNNYDQKLMQTESKTKTKEKDYTCKYCNAKLDLSEIQKASLRKGMVLNKVICPKCKKSNQVKP